MAKCKNCINLQNHWCDMVADSPDVESERECGHYKRMTRADRIHSMNIEETADLLYSFHSLEDKVKFCKNKTECEEILDSGKEIPGDMCKKCLVEWLQSEVEV